MVGKVCGQSQFMLKLSLANVAFEHRLQCRADCLGFRVLPPCVLVELSGGGKVLIANGAGEWLLPGMRTQMVVICSSIDEMFVTM